MQCLGASFVPLSFIGEAVNLSPYCNKYKPSHERNPHCNKAQKGTTAFDAQSTGLTYVLGLYQGLLDKSPNSLSNPNQRQIYEHHKSNNDFDNFQSICIKSLQSNIDSNKHSLVTLFQLKRNAMTFTKRTLMQQELHTCYSIELIPGNDWTTYPLEIPMLNTLAAYKQISARVTCIIQSTVRVRDP